MSTSTSTAAEGDGIMNAEIEDLEQRFWQAMKSNDVEACLKLSDFPTLVVGAQGAARVDESAFRSMMQSAPYTLKEFALSDFTIRPVRDDVVVSSYKAHLRMSVDGEAVEVDTAQLSTWIRRDGAWRCAAHSESILGDPLGRDRHRVQ